jgi:hypothetical protein
MDHFPTTFAFVQYHLSDDFALPFGNARQSFYGVTAIPTSVFQGEHIHVGDYGQAHYETDYNTYRSQPADMTIQLWGRQVSGQKYHVKAEVGVEAGASAKTFRFWMVQVLDFWPAEGGYHRDGFKQAYPADHSTPLVLTLQPGQKTLVETDFTFDADSWGDQQHIRIIAWAQPDSAAPAPVYQAAIMNWPFPPDAGLQVDPIDDLFSSGPHGGPFTPEQITYTLSNSGDYTIDYQVTHPGADWVTLTGQLAGALPPGGTTPITATINANATHLANGDYSDVLQLTNLTDHLGDTTRTVHLEVGAPGLIYSWNMDADPGWATEGSWAWGRPTGGNGDHGNPDPTAGHTGVNVYGYNLAGGYTNNMPEYHLTTAAIDCSDLHKVHLRFWRWLGVEKNTYDHAYVRVSKNGVDWANVWANGATDVTDTAWTQQDYDISAIADGQATVYVRWTMGATDVSYTFCGWNIDDAEIWGVPPSYPLGDMNCDGAFDGFDIDPFFLALGDPDGYQQAFPDCDIMNGDINGDDEVDGFDINPFFDLLGG